MAFNPLVPRSSRGRPTNEIKVRTFQENVRARRFYERHGFQVLELSDGSTNEENCYDEDTYTSLANMFASIFQDIKDKTENKTLSEEVRKEWQAICDKLQQLDVSKAELVEHLGDTYNEIYNSAALDTPKTPEPDLPEEQQIQVLRMQ